MLNKNGKKSVYLEKGKLLLIQNFKLEVKTDSANVIMLITLWISLINCEGTGVSENIFKNSDTFANLQRGSKNDVSYKVIILSDLLWYGLICFSSLSRHCLVFVSSRSRSRFDLDSISILFWFVSRPWYSFLLYETKVSKTNRSILLFFIQPYSREKNVHGVEIHKTFQRRFVKFP